MTPIDRIRAALAELETNFDALQVESKAWQAAYDDCEDALIGEQLRDSYGHGESIADCARRVLRERDQLRARLVDAEHNSQENAKLCASTMAKLATACAKVEALEANCNAQTSACNNTIRELRARLAEIEAAPTVAWQVDYIGEGEAVRHLVTGDEPHAALYRDLPNAYTVAELIARPQVTK